MSLKTSNISEDFDTISVDSVATDESQIYGDNYEAQTEIDRLTNVNEKLRLKNSRYKDTSELRKSLAVIFTLTINIWLFVVFLILVSNNKLFNLSDNVLITLLTTTTIQVIGMMLIILRNLFPKTDK